MFPKELARGLDVRLGARVLRLAIEGGGSGSLPGRGNGARGRSCSLCRGAGGRAARHARRPRSRRRARGARLLGMVGSLPCLTLLAGYPPGRPEPPWDVCYPEDSETLQLLSHDSAKRPAPRFRVLVLQAHAALVAGAPRRAEGGLVGRASRRGGPAGRALGRAAVLDAGALWRYARTDPGTELGAPLISAAAGRRGIGSRERCSARAAASRRRGFPAVVSRAW